MQTIRSKAAAASAVVVTAFLTVMAGMASAAPADPLEDAIDTAESTITGYAAPIIAAIVAVLVAFLGVKLLPKAWKAVTARLG